MQFKLGMVFRPLLEIIEHPDRFDDQEKAERQAQYFDGYQTFLNQFRLFCSGQPGHNYQIQFLKMLTALCAIQDRLSEGSTLINAVEPNLAIAQAAIDAIPVPRLSVILEAGSPFTAYIKLRELCEADATKTLTWLDPYMGDTLFLRYVSSVRSDVPVTLVTSKPGSKPNQRDTQRWAQFLDISRLYAQERGPMLYRLVVQPNLHDRWVVFDEKRIYALGGSAKDAGAKDDFTISSIEASPENLQRIQNHISSGMEWFGPAVTTHQ